jgi:hypothetical protein
MTIEIPFEIGDTIVVDGVEETIKGVHVYIGNDGRIRKWRLYIGHMRFITIPRGDVVNGPI